jgi:REP element-mobilizing transposase RayT
LQNTLSAVDRKHFRKLKDRLFHHALDECHGECLLRNQDLATIVANAMVYYNGKAYDLESFVIMPNHVHAIVQFRAEFDLTIIGQSWMRYTARAINKQRNAQGAFWAPEPFDHLIRSDEQFRYLRNYVAANPEKAGLLPGNYLYWSSV